MVDSVTIIGLTTVAVLTFLLIGLPALYLLALIVADDDDAFDRRVRDIEQSVKLGQRLHAYESGKDVYAVLEEPLTMAPLGRRPQVSNDRYVSDASRALSSSSRRIRSSW
jgi:hypothetical protein